MVSSSPGWISRRLRTVSASPGTEEEEPEEGVEGAAKKVQFGSQSWLMADAWA